LPTWYPYSLRHLARIDPPITGAKLPLAKDIKDFDFADTPVDPALRDIVVKAFDRATEVLRARRADLDEGAHLLLQHETVTADQFPAIRPAGPQIKSTA
jgi:hypothetical protein